MKARPKAIPGDFDDHWDELPKTEQIVRSVVYHFILSISRNYRG